MLRRRRSTDNSRIIFPIGQDVGTSKGVSCLIDIEVNKIDSRKIFFFVDLRHVQISCLKGLFFFFLLILILIYAFLIRQSSLFSCPHGV